MSIIKKITLFLGIIILFSACLDKNMPDLEVYNRSYIVQTNSTNPSFTPMICYLSNYELAEAHIVKDEKKLSVRWIGWENRYIEGFSSTPVFNITEINGTYKADIISAKKGSIEEKVTFNFSESDVLGEFKVNEFSFKDNHIKASWEEVKNANYFGIIVEPVYRDQQGNAVYVRNYNHLVIFPDTTSHLFNNNTMNMNPGTYNLTLSDSIGITLVAAYVDYNNRTLLVKGPQKHIRADLDCFTEDEGKKEEEEEI